MKTCVAIFMAVSLGVGMVLALVGLWVTAPWYVWLWVMMFIFGGCYWRPPTSDRGEKPVGKYVIGACPNCSQPTGSNHLEDCEVRLESIARSTK